MENCISLTENAERISREDLYEISRESLDTLIDIFKKINNDYLNYRNQCSSILSIEIFDYYKSVFTIALLKISTVISDKVRDIGYIDSNVERIISMFSDDEKKLIREFERFNILDPNTIHPSLLAEYIVSKREGIYELIKEAVRKQYIFFDKLIESWSSEYRVSSIVRKGLLNRYRARFVNIVDAVKILLDQHPAWIMRLFSDYEDALLRSAEVRELFDQKIREIFEDRLKDINDYVEKLEEERRVLVDKIEELSMYIKSRRVDVELELNELRNRLQDLEKRYIDVLSKWEKGLGEIDLLRKQLADREKELSELSKKERENTAAREAIEAEVVRLKQLIDNYENRVREYESEKNNLLLKLAETEEKLTIMEKSLRGESGSRLIPIEETILLETIFIGKIRDRLETLPMEIMTPWGVEKIDRWDSVKTYIESTKYADKTPRNTRIIYTYRKKKWFGLGESKTINIMGAYVVDLKHVEQGLVYKQANLEDLLRVIRDIPSTTRGERVFTLIGLASPTGWSERAVRYVRGDGGPSLITRDMVVILIDLLENKIYYPESAKTYSEQWARLFVVETGIEEETRVEKTIIDMCDEAKARSPMEPVFPYSDLRERLKNISPISLSRVLNRLIGRKIIELRKGEKEYLVICRNRG